MPAVLRESGVPLPQIPLPLGPRGPFPDAPMQRMLERRWLHYAFLSRDNELGLVANVAWLGPDPEKPDAPTRNTSILLLYRRGAGWWASQFNAAHLAPLWSAFRMPHQLGKSGRFEVGATAETPAVRLDLQRSSYPCTSQCAPFAKDQHFRWQSEAGILSRGEWHLGNGELVRDVDAIGYHERVRGNWSWSEMGGWLFGFANDPTVTEAGAPPPWALVFTLIQPPEPPDAAAASVMLWRDGRVRRHFPRRNISVAVRGLLDRNQVQQVPELSNLFGVPPMAPIPRRLCITAQLGRDWVLLDFTAEAAARIIIPNETGIDPFSVHEVIGPCHIEGELNGQSFTFTTSGIVEFAGGAGGL